QLERHADAREMFIGILAAGLVRIDDCERWRISVFFVRQMMIRYDHVEPIVAGPDQRFETADTAIDRDHERKPVGLGLFKSGRVDAIALGKAVRHVKACFGTKHLERPTEQYSSSCSVDVVVAPNEDLFAVF